MLPPGKNDGRDAERIMAWSETLFERVPPGRPAFALWRPKGAAVAIGVSQSAETDVLPEAIRRDGVALVRRPSGGGSVVLCEGVLCWEAWADQEDIGGGIHAAYEALSKPVVQGLRDLGVPASRAGVSDIVVADPATGHAACVRRKLAGTAQLRRRAKVLVHGSLLVNADLALLSRYLPQPAKAPDYRAGRGHGAFCANVGRPMAVVGRAIGGAAESLGWRIMEPPEAMPPEIEDLAQRKYYSPDWNWRKKRP